MLRASLRLACRLKWALPIWAFQIVRRCFPPPLTQASPGAKPSSTPIVVLRPPFSPLRRAQWAKPPRTPVIVYRPPSFSSVLRKRGGAMLSCVQGPPRCCNSDGLGPHSFSGDETNQDCRYGFLVVLQFCFWDSF